MAQIINRKKQRQSVHTRIDDEIYRAKEMSKLMGWPERISMELINLMKPESIERTMSDLAKAEMIDELNMGMVREYYGYWLEMFNGLMDFEKDNLSQQMSMVESTILTALQSYWGPVASIKVDRYNMSVICSAPSKEDFVLNNVTDVTNNDLTSLFEGSRI